MPPAARRRVIHYNAASRMRLGPEPVFTGNARVKFYVAHKRCIYVHTPPGRSSPFFWDSGEDIYLTRSPDEWKPAFSLLLFFLSFLRSLLIFSLLFALLLLAGGPARNLKQRRLSPVNRATSGREIGPGCCMFDNVHRLLLRKIVRFVKNLEVHQKYYCAFN